MAALEGVPPRVVLTGSESTGKTTLARELARHYGTLWVPEFVRGYAARKGAPLGADDVEPIARGQMALEDAAIASAGRSMLVLDTDLLSTVVYAEHYYGACPGWIREAAVARRGDLYLLCDIDVTWEADPVRDRAGAREVMQALFREALVARRFPYIEVAGGVTERLEIVRRAIDLRAIP